MFTHKGLRNFMTLGADSFMKRYHSAGVEEGDQLRLVVRQTVVGRNLEDRVDKDPRLLSLQLLRISLYHCQKVLDEVWTKISRIQFQKKIRNSIITSGKAQCLMGTRSVWRR